MEDASHPERYSVILAQNSVDLLYQDIAQRNQLDILLKNLHYLRSDGHIVFMVKTRSISQEITPVDIVRSIKREMVEVPNITAIASIDLAPYQKDHFAIIGRKRE